MSALTPKADITEGYDLYPVLTQSGHQRNECLLATMNVAAGRFGGGTYTKGGDVSGRHRPLWRKSFNQLLTMPMTTKMVR